MKISDELQIGGGAIKLEYEVDRADAVTMTTLDSGYHNAYEGNARIVMDRAQLDGLIATLQRFRRRWKKERR